MLGKIVSGKTLGGGKKNKKKNIKSTNMQTNSLPKLDTTKHTCIFHYHKQSK